jgi:hypothetical protein
MNGFLFIEDQFGVEQQQQQRVRTTQPRLQKLLDHESSSFQVVPQR